MIRRRPTDEELDNYPEVQEEKDVNRLQTFASKLSHVEHELLLCILLNEYSNLDLFYVLDNALDDDIKEELADIWHFRQQTGMTGE